MNIEAFVLRTLDISISANFFLYIGEFDIDLTDSVAFKFVKKIENMRTKRIFFIFNY